MAFSYWELDVPGILCVKRDLPSPSWGAYSPWPLDYGPICERCWIDDRYVCPLAHPTCPHGGARATEVES